MSLVSSSTASSARRSGVGLPALVEGVAPGHVGGHRLVVEPGDLGGPALGPHLGAGAQVHLEHGVGEHDRADVAALQHAAAPLVGPLPLAAHQLGSRTPGLAATSDTARDTSGPRISMVASTPSTRTRSAVTSSSTTRASSADRAGVGGVDAPAQGRERDRPVHGPRVEVLEPEPLGQAAGDGRLAGARGPVDRDDLHGQGTLLPRRPALPARRPSSVVPVAGERLGHAVGVRDLDARRPAGRAGRSSSPCGGRRRSRPGPAAGCPGGPRSRRAPRRASMPQRRSSRTTAAMRSVSWPRMKPTPRTRVGPSANTATAARVWAMSGMSDRSTSPSPRRRRRRRPRWWRRRCARRGRPWRPARRRSGRRPARLPAPRPSTVTRPPRWRRRPGSTRRPTRRARPGRRCPGSAPAGTVNTRPPASSAPRRTATPNAAITATVRSTYGRRPGGSSPEPHPARGVGRRQQQARQELAGRVAGHVDLARRRGRRGRPR